MRRAVKGFYPVKIESLRGDKDGGRNTSNTRKQSVIDVDFKNSPSMKLNSSTSDSLFEKRIWSIEDASNYSGYAVGTLYNLTSKDLIPHRKKRGKLYFIPHEIQNWIEEGDL